MDRWSALSMVESGDNDAAIGHVGEISRYQIRPELWPGGDPHNCNLALAAARKIMQKRLEAFRARHQREASDWEFYILWNAPCQVNHPSSVVRARANRYLNLVQRT
jgi:hypothetical protein